MTIAIAAEGCTITFGQSPWSPSQGALDWLHQAEVLIDRPLIIAHFAAEDFVEIDGPVQFRRLQNGECGGQVAQTFAAARLRLPLLTNRLQPIVLAQRETILD